MNANGGQIAAKERILIVDDEVLVCELLQYKLQSEGFDVSICHSGPQAMTLPLSSYNLVIVDLMNNPTFSGLKFAREFKSTPDTLNIPLIICSTKASEDDIVTGLDAGADDYISKPFSSREFIARVKSILRRRRMISGRRMNNVMRYKGLEVDLGAGTVTVDGEKISLSRTEFLILAMFLRHRNQFFERSEIQHEAWEGEGAVSDRAVDTNISRLRKKIGDYGRNIVNRQGFGYGFIE